MGEREGRGGGVRESGRLFVSWTLLVLQVCSTLQRSLYSSGDAQKLGYKLLVYIRYVHVRMYLCCTCTYTCTFRYVENLDMMYMYM